MDETRTERTAPETVVTLSASELEHVLQVLDRELAGHHNRAEGYLVGDLSGVEGAEERARECMRAAARVREVRGRFLRAQREASEGRRFHEVAARALVD